VPKGPRKNAVQEKVKVWILGNRPKRGEGSKKPRGLEGGGSIRRGENAPEFVRGQNSQGGLQSKERKISSNLIHVQTK